MDQAEFTPGTHVLVRSLKKRGVIDSVLSGNRFKVAVGSLSVLCEGGDLSLASAAPEATQGSISFVRASQAPPPTRIDLHGMTVDDATRAVEDLVNRAVLGGVQQLTIVHGFGTGRLQSAVHTLLSKLPIVRAFRVSDRNPGETLVYIA
jgi:DNA mismatch repair protein MutS2